jgi:LCP family protein required for cell wall assembly
LSARDRSGPDDVVDLAPSKFKRSPALARTKTRHYPLEGEELRKWREGLERALHKPKKRRRPLRFVAATLVLLIVAVGVGGYLYWRVIGGQFDRVGVDVHAAEGNVLNVLLVGSDSREGLAEAGDTERFGQVGGQRADTIILAQLVPTQQRGVLLHFPRDLYVPVHAEGSVREGKINSSYGYGPQSVINTVSALTRMPINHYMEIDIRGFRAMVDAVGGIDVTNDTALYDSKLNFRLPAGTSHLDGNKALSFVRARYATPDGDFGRIRRQQQFIRAVMSKVGQPSVLANPVRVNQLAQSFAANVKVDQYFQLDTLVRFALSVRRIGPDQLETFSVPGDVGARGGQSVVLMDTVAAEPIFAALREGRDPKDLLPRSQAQGG